MLNELRVKVLKNLQVIESLRAENQLLKTNIQQILVDKQQWERLGTADPVDSKNRTLAQALPVSSDQDIQKIKVQVEEYLKEIDQCLALLNCE